MAVAIRVAMPAAAKCYVALGANLGDPPAQLNAALARLRQHTAIELLAVSPFYRTPPLGPAGQPDYCNAVCALRTTLQPEALLDLLQAIEQDAGRVRGEHWGARVLDLDLLLVEGVVMATPRLTLPHPELHRRAFVLVPFADIAPEQEIRGLGTVAQLADAIDRSGIEPGFSAG